MTYKLYTCINDKYSAGLQTRNCAEHPHNFFIFLKITVADNTQGDVNRKV